MMRIICCKCHNTYFLSEHIFETPNTNRPVLLCPFCGFTHLIDFIPFNKDLELNPIKELDLGGGPYYIVLYETRIADSSRVDQSGEADGNVVDWDKTDDFILCTAFNTASKAVEAVTLKVQFQDLDDGGGYGDVGNTGEITYNGTGLTDDNAVAVGERICGTGGDTWQDGKENQGDNEAPDGTTYTLAEDYETEFQWALDCDGADDGHEYGFQIWDTNNDLLVGVCGATLTIAAGATTYYQNVNATAIGTASVSTLSTFYRTLSATAIGTATVVTALKYVQSISATAIGTATVNTVIIFAQAISATAIGTATIIKKVSKYLNVTAIGTATLVKNVKKYLNVTAVGTATVNTAAIFIQAISATATGIANVATSFIPAGSGAVCKVRSMLEWLISKRS